MIHDDVVFSMPADIAACQLVRIELLDVKSNIISFETNSVRPVKKQKNEAFNRITEINMLFPGSVRIASAKAGADGKKIQILGSPSSTLALPTATLIPSEAEMVTYYGRTKKRKIISAFYF
jgi:hypothetical protein